MIARFLRLLPYVRRTIWRARVRSGLTIIGTALAMGLFAFVQMLDQGVSAMDEAADRPVLVVFQSSRFCPLTSLLPMRYEQEIEQIEGVDSVLPTLIYINACRANLDLVTLHGVDPARLEGIHELKAIEGDLSSWKGRRDAAIVGQRLADRRGLKVGERVRLTNVDVLVSGIFESSGGGLDNVAFVTMDQLQIARDQQGIATQFFVSLDEGADGEGIARLIDQRFATAEQPTDTKTMQAFVQGAVGEVGEVVGFARLLGYLAVAVVVLILGNTVFISAQTRRKELGVMETVGVTRGLLGSLVLSEGILLALIGGVLGVGAVCWVLGANPLTVGIEGWGIDIAPSAAVVVKGAVVAVLVGIAASILPVIEALRRPLADAVKDA